MLRNNYIFNKINATSHVQFDNASYIGVAIKSIIMLAFTIISACISIIIFNKFSTLSILFYSIAFIGTLVLQIIISFSLKTTKILAIPYAVFEGFMIGVLCSMLELILPGEGLIIAALSFMITIGIFFASIIVLNKNMFNINMKFRTTTTIIIIGISIGTLIFTMIDLILYFTFRINLYLIYFSSPFSILISLIMVVLSTFYAYCNVNSANEMIKNGVSREYEWSIAFGIVTSIIMLFIEVLYLLIKISFNRRRD